MDGIDEIRAFDHIVLLVAAKAMLRTKGGGEAQAGSGQGIEAVGEVAGDGSRMRNQGDALALQLFAQFRVGQQPLDAQFHSALTPSNSRDRTVAAWKSGLPGANAFDQ